MEGIKLTGVQKALGKLVGQAAQAVEAEERQRQYDQMLKHQAQAEHEARQRALQQLGQASMWGQQQQNLYNTLGTAGQASWPNHPQLGGGLNGPYSSGYANVKPYPPSVTFTDEQMSLLMAKLVALLAKGWECLRCHRIWSPQVNGCEFCNFIDRLEGKDVDRDDAAA